MATTVIAGTTNIEDTWMYAFTPNQCNGGQIDLRIYAIGETWEARGLMRALTPAIPNGALQTCTLNFKVKAPNTGTITEFYRVSEANADWPEGNRTGSGPTPADPSANWKYKSATANDAGIDWAGAQGLYTSGVDYEANASPPSHTTAGIEDASVVLPSNWFADWRDGNWANGGILLVNGNVSAPWTIIIGSTEDTGGLDPNFNIDYVPPLGTKLVYIAK
jgi:hypothetical protein